MELRHGHPHGELQRPGCAHNGDGFGDIITASASSNFGALVRVFSGQNGRQIDSFLAFDDKRVKGVFVSAGEINGDGRADIIAGTDATKAPNLRAFSRPGFGIPSAVLADILLDAAYAGGVRVASADVNADGIADIIASTGKSKTPQIRIYDGATTGLLNTIALTDKDSRTGLFVG